MWLLEEQKAREIRHAIAADKLPTLEARETHRLAQETAENEARVNDGHPRNMSVADGVAEIRVEGILTLKFDLIAWLFGEANTTYESIMTSLSIAATDPNVKRVAWVVDSPGGMVDGLFETLAAIEVFGKPQSVRASKAASAAYALAAAAGSITAVSPASSFGSVGVVATFFVGDELIDVTSTEAPNKRPDVTTDEGKAVVREYLDAIHGLFVDSIASGRSRATGQKMTAKQVNAEFGRGSMFVAKDAKARGMIDKAPAALRAVKPAAEAGAIPALVAGHNEMVATEMVPRDRDNTNSTADGGGLTPTQERTMDLNQLKTEHSAVYEAAVKIGEEQGAESGAVAERKRVNAHLNMGQKFGAMDIAIKAVKDGADFMDPEVQSEYMTAGRNKTDVETRQSETDAADQMTQDAKPDEGTKDLQDIVADNIAAGMAL